MLFFESHESGTPHFFRSFAKHSLNLNFNSNWDYYIFNIFNIMCYACPLKKIAQLSLNFNLNCCMLTVDESSTHHPPGLVMSSNYNFNFDFINKF